MKKIVILALVAAAVAIASDKAAAQSTSAVVVSACGTPPATYPVGGNRQVTQDQNGNLCMNPAGGGGSTVTANQGTPNAGGANAWPVQNNPTATATSSGITDVSSSALESNHVLKAAPGNLYSVYITTGAVQGWLLTYNGTTAPAAGGAAIAPVDCIYAPANQTTGLSMNGDPPDPFATGIVAIFSTSGCLTNTASTTAFFKGRVK